MPDYLVDFVDPDRPTKLGPEQPSEADLAEWQRQMDDACTQMAAYADDDEAAREAWAVEHGYGSWAAYEAATEGDWTDCSELKQTSQN